MAKSTFQCVNMEAKTLRRGGLQGRTVLPRADNVVMSYILRRMFIDLSVMSYVTRQLNFFVISILTLCRMSYGPTRHGCPHGGRVWACDVATTTIDAPARARAPASPRGRVEWGAELSGGAGGRLRVSVADEAVPG